MLFLKRSHPLVALIVFAVSVLSSSCATPAQAEEAQTPTCASFLQNVQSSDKALHWTPPTSNIFSETLPITLLSTVAWLSTVETVRQVGFQEHPELTSTFLRTVPIDATLSTLSHAIALGHLPWLKRFLTAEGLPPSVEFWARTASNGLISTAVISTAWAVSGIPLSGEHVLGAFTLCAAVYPTLQKLKSYLFKVFPFQRDAYYQRHLQSRLPDEMNELSTSSQNQAQSLGLNESEIEALFLSSLEALLTSKPYEVAIESAAELRNSPIIRNWVRKISKPGISPAKKMKLRRKLINELLLIETQSSTSEELRSEIKALLNLGAPFSDGSSLEFHRVFRDRYATYRTRLVIASFLDQAFAVGLAGGVFLYSTTYWAAHGQWPW